MPNFTWIPDAYSVDKMGNVYADTNWRGYGVRALCQSLNSNGYPSVRMVFPDGTRKRIAVHRIVAETFLGSLPSPQHQVRHLNGDKEDNRADNLAYGTVQENALDRSRHGRAYRPDWNDPQLRAKMLAGMKAAPRKTRQFTDEQRRQCAEVMRATHAKHPEIRERLRNKAGRKRIEVNA